MISAEHVKILSQRYSKAINHPDFLRGVFVVDMENKITAVNPKLLSMLAYENESELLGNHATIIIPPPYLYYNSTGQKMTNAFYEVGFAGSIRYMTKKDGRATLVSFSGYAIKKDGQNIGIHFEASSLENLSFLSQPMDDIIKKTEDFMKSLQGMMESFRGGLPDSISPAERIVAGLIRKGFATKEIATELSIAPKTVENHRTTIRGKLGMTPGQTLQDCLSIYQF